MIPKYTAFTAETYLLGTDKQGDDSATIPFITYSKNEEGNLFVTFEYHAM